MPSVDHTFGEIVGELDADLRPVARELPRRLRLTTSAEGSWGDFVRLAPTRDPVAFAREGQRISADALLPFVGAHHACGFYGILLDRVADHQIELDDPLRRIRKGLRRAWERRLAVALGSTEAARRVIARSVSRWRKGFRLERELLAGRSADPTSDYPRMLHLKLGWIASTPHAMLERFGETWRADRFRLAFHLFLSGLQVRDDVADRAEDRALWGRDVPSVLGASDGCLLRLATLLFSAAARTAHDGQFVEFGAWLTAYAAESDVFVEGSDRLSDQLLGMAMFERWRGALTPTATEASR